MNTKMRENARIQHIGWSTGIVGGLLLISLGFELLAHQVFGQTDLGTLLWALYLGFWSFALGTIGLLLLAVQWLVEWRRIQTTPATVSRLSSAESTSSRFEKPEMEGPFLTLQQSMTSVAPGRPSWECHDRNRWSNQRRVM